MCRTPWSRSPTSIWRPQEKRLVIGLNRFDWEGAQDRHPDYRRRRSALRFERVLTCQCKSVNPAGKDAVLNLLAVEFAETDAPAGVVTLIFSGGAALRLDVECLEAELADLGPVWAAAGCPAHPADPTADPSPRRARLTAAVAAPITFPFRTPPGAAPVPRSA